MSQVNLPVASRGFKSILDVDRFQDRAAGATVFRKLAELIIEKNAGGRIINRQKEE